jgi:hypothetical protein
LLYYTQGVVTAFSHVHVVNDAGAVIPTGKLVSDPSDQQTVIVRLGRALGLGPGGYSLSWQVTSVDTHVTQGTYHFTVSNPAGGRGGASRRHKPGLPPVASPAAIFQEDQLPAWLSRLARTRARDGDKQVRRILGKAMEITGRIDSEQSADDLIRAISALKVLLSPSGMANPSEVR